MGCRGDSTLNPLGVAPRKPSQASCDPSTPLVALGDVAATGLSPSLGARSQYLHNSEARGPAPPASGGWEETEG